ncbi:uncharacterized protein EDB91DRAFT_1259545 [Suillus paluster]|uniref:uncharacterized protein n=1 Tax=Suillus paluster TaxID=48578 RepID=UPI001B86E1F7|nr:uncharacterized protein EDB91DRAFT_1259545 [Suillus paluster]KAG1717567.1 hypothetical protein EDB91DRAFT_1259545 [Suillus paluster]
MRATLDSNGSETLLASSTTPPSPNLAKPPHPLARLADPPHPLVRLADPPQQATFALVHDRSAVLMAKESSIGPISIDHFAMYRFIDNKHRFPIARCFCTTTNHEHDLYTKLQVRLATLLRVDVPFVFLTSSRPAVAAPSTDSILASLPSISLHGRNTQLPSPISPTTQPSPTPAPCIPNLYSLHSPEIPLTPGSSDQALCVLQTALRYLEAIRVKVPEVVTQEKVDPGSTCEKESVERIVQGEVSAGLDGPTSSTETSMRRRSNRETART